MSGNDKNMEERKKETDARREYICDVCGYKTPLKGNFNRHRLTHTNEKPFSCPYTTCSEDSARECNRPRHILLEPGDAVRVGYTPCGESFRYKYELRDHVRTHTGETPFKCTVPECGSSFSLFKEFSTHLKTHTKAELEQQQSQHRCRICQKSFETEDKLERHLKSHASKSKNPFICFVHKCGFKCDSYRELDSHKKQNHDADKDKKFKCPSCPYIGHTEGFLTRHMRIHAKGEEKEGIPGEKPDSECPNKEAPSGGGRRTDPVSPQHQGETDVSSSDFEEIPHCSTSLPPKKRFRRK